MAQIFLPDALASWPFPRRINRHYTEVKVEAERWIHALNVLDPKAQKAFDKCNFVLLAAHVYPGVNRDQLRVASDLIMLFFVFDEFTDKVDRDGVQIYIDMVADALERPHIVVPINEGGCNLREMTRQFWAHAIAIAPPAAQRRFKKTFIEYIKAVAFEAQDRVDDNIRGVESYLQLRRMTAGGYPALFPIDLSVDIPDDVMQHSTLVAFSSILPESLILLNDIYSYNIEQAASHHAHNLVTVVMHEYGVSIQDAMSRIGRYHAEHLQKFSTLKAELPSWGADIDRDIATYIEGIAQGIRGIDSWSFETQRYFGAKAEEVRQTRLVTLLPKVGHDVATPMTVPDLVAADRSQDEKGRPEANKISYSATFTAKV